MRPGALPALKSPPLPAIGKEIIVPVPKGVDVAATAESTSDRAATATPTGLLQSVRVYVTVESGGPRIALARDGSSAPEGAVEAILVATAA